MIPIQNNILDKLRSHVRVELTEERIQNKPIQESRLLLLMRKKMRHIVKGRYSNNKQDYTLGFVVKRKPITQIAKTNLPIQEGFNSGFENISQSEKNATDHRRDEWIPKGKNGLARLCGIFYRLVGYRLVCHIGGDETNDGSTPTDSNLAHSYFSTQ